MTILVEITLAAKSRVVREKAVYEERFANESSGRREAAELKTVLPVALEPRRHGGDGGVRVERATVPPGTRVRLGATTLVYDDPVERYMTALDPRPRRARLLVRRDFE